MSSPQVGGSILCLGCFFCEAMLQLLRWGALLGDNGRCNRLIILGSLAMYVIFKDCFAMRSSLTKLCVRAYYWQHLRRVCIFYNSKCLMRNIGATINKSWQNAADSST